MHFKATIVPGDPGAKLYLRFPSQTMQRNPALTDLAVDRLAADLQGVYLGRTNQTATFLLPHAHQHVDESTLFNIIDRYFDGDLHIHNGVLGAYMHEEESGYRFEIPATPIALSQIPASVGSSLRFRVRDGTVYAEATADERTRDYVIHQLSSAGLVVVPADQR